jgi:hypothetical protein
VTRCCRALWRRGGRAARKSAPDSDEPEHATPRYAGGTVSGRSLRVLPRAPPAPPPGRCRTRRRRTGPSRTCSPRKIEVLVVRRGGFSERVLRRKREHHRATARQARRRQRRSQTRSAMRPRPGPEESDDACIRDAASARAALSPRSLRTTRSRADRRRTRACFPRRSERVDTPHTWRELADLTRFRRPRRSLGCRRRRR